MKDTIQVGVLAMRDPKTGAFLSAQPIIEEQNSDTAEVMRRFYAKAGQLLGGIMSEDGVLG